MTSITDAALYVNSVSYTGVAQFAASTHYNCGDIVRQLTAPSVGNERCFICTIGNATSGAEPTWAVTYGAANVSGPVTFNECTARAQLNGDNTNVTNWTAVKGLAVPLGAVITSNDGTKILMATTGGTAGSGAEPTWAAYTVAGATTADNAVTWTTLKDNSNVFGNWAAPAARSTITNTTAFVKASQFIFLGDNHAESQTTALAFGGNATDTRWISVDHTQNLPAPYKTGASLSITGGGNVALSLASGTNNTVFYAGITFNGSSSTGSGSGIVVGTSGPYTYCYQCNFSVTGTGGLVLGNTFQGQYYFENCNFTFGSNAGTGFKMFNGRCTWHNGTLTLGATQPTSLFSGPTNGTRAGEWVIDGVDLSAFTGTNLFIDNSPFISGQAQLKDCKLGAFSNVGSFGAYYGLIVDMLRCDSANTSYRQRRDDFNGTMVTDTTITRSGGATDGVTPISWKLTTTANPNFEFTFEAPPLRIWNSKTSPVTITIYGAGATVPNDNQLLYDVVYPGDPSSTLGSYATAGQTDPLSSSSAWTTDSGSSWTGSPAHKFKKSITVTPGQAGYIYVYPKQAAASVTWNIDPKIGVS